MPRSASRARAYLSASIHRLSFQPIASRALRRGKSSDSLFRVCSEVPGDLSFPSFSAIASRTYSARLPRAGWLRDSFSSASTASTTSIGTDTISRLTGLPLNRLAMLMALPFSMPLDVL